MKYLVTILEQTPTEDRTDLNSYHVQCSDLFEVASTIENFAINFGLLVSLMVVPVK